MHRLPGDNAGGLQLHTLALVGLDWAVAVDGVAEGVDDSAEHALADGDVDDGAGSLDDVTLLDLSTGVGGWRAYLSFPRTTIPTLSVSKLRAIPLIPELNSTISPAWTLVRPKTLAIPSPIEITVPNSLRSFY